LHYSIPERTALVTFNIRLSSVLHDLPDTYSIGTPLKENVVALLVNTSRLEFDSGRAIRMCHLYEILRITLWSLGSVRNKYQKHLLRGKGDLCAGLTTLPTFGVFAIFSG